MPKVEIRVEPKLKVLRADEIPHLLVPGEVGAILELSIKNKDGKITDHRLMKSESFVRQFLELLWIQAVQIPECNPYSIRDITNTLVDICEGCYTFACNGAIAAVNQGIIVGTGNTAPTINDYVIQTIIPHDAAPPTGGALQYSVVSFGAPASDATTSQFTITRNFANASGGAITVNEIGLYVRAYKWNASFYFLTIRDVIVGGIAVPDGETLTVNYREQAVI